MSRWRRLWQRERLLDAELRDHVEVTILGRSATWDLARLARFMAATEASGLREARAPPCRAAAHQCIQCVSNMDTRTEARMNRVRFAAPLLLLLLRSAR